MVQVLLSLESEALLVQFMERHQPERLVVLQHVPHLVRDDPQLGDDLLHVLQYSGLIQLILLLNLLTECQAEPPEVLGLLEETHLYRVLQLLHRQS